MNTSLLCRIVTVQVVVVVLDMAAGEARPYLRSNLARTLYDRMLKDERLRNMDLKEMYAVDELALTDWVRERMVPLGPDPQTRSFLDNCLEQSEWFMTQVWQSVAKAFLGLFMTQTSVNGLLGRGRMFVWSEDQARRLLGPDDKELVPPPPTAHSSTEAPGSSSVPWSGFRILDLGAGDGHVTHILAQQAGQVDVTEASPIMRRRLRERGYRVLDAWEWVGEVEDGYYDVVTCLNLLDRCDTPRSLLHDIHAKLAPDGLLVVALVLPFSAYVETGTIDNLPSEELGIAGSTIEEQVNSIATTVFPALGFSLARWSRLPYLCEGDLDQAFYWLTDVVFVFRKKTNTATANVDENEQFFDAVESVPRAIDKQKTDL